MRWMSRCVNVMQNPSDPGATYDGHKGPGYQVQLSETCNPDNEVQLITCAIPQTAAESDANSFGEVVKDLEANDLVCDEMLADTHYTGDQNVQVAQEHGIEGTNSGLKRRTGLGQLRVRGQPRVFGSILLKVAGWNILRAAACAKMRQIVYARANAAVFWLCFTLLIKRIAAQTVRRGPRKNFSVCPRQFTEFQRFYVAA
jgi:hypothetical protein